jgi:hypothetical protein
MCCCDKARSCRGIETATVSLVQVKQMLKPVIEFGKRLAFRYTPLGKPYYPYPNVEPIELATLINEIERQRDVKGSIVEIGVARGMTTYFMSTHLAMSGLEEQKLIAIDTFASFREDDLQYEVKNRGKTRAQLQAFAYNDYERWKKTSPNFRLSRRFKRIVRNWTLPASALSRWRFWTST